jgi:sugar lactone lactonase YvrE
MHSSVIRALTSWKHVATSVVVSAAMSIVVCWSIEASADTPHKEFTADVLVNPNAYYPEGPQLIDEGLLVAEMPRHRIVLIANNGERKTVWQADGCGPTSIKRIPSGGYWVLCHLAGYVAKLNPTFQTVQTFRETMSGKRISWPNDASVDSSGNLYLSSSGLFSLDAPAEGRVVFIDLATGAASDIASGIRYSNGVLLQEQIKRLLVSEHLNRRMLAFPLLDKGKLGPSTIFFDFKNAPAVPDAYEQSGPDGIAAFADGDIAVADYGNGRILLLSSSGKFLTQIPLKYRFVTNLAVARDQRTIFVTMTRDNSSPEMDGVVQAFKVTPGKE